MSLSKPIYVTTSYGRTRAVFRLFQRKHDSVRPYPYVTITEFDDDGEMSMQNIGLRMGELNYVVETISHIRKDPKIYSEQIRRRFKLLFVCGNGGRYMDTILQQGDSASGILLRV